MNRTLRTDALVADVEHQYCAELQPLIDMTEHARQLERELNSALICAGVASKERGEWAGEREDLVDALERYQALFFGRLGNLEHMGTDEFRVAHLKAYLHASEVLKTWGHPRERKNPMSGAWTCQYCGFVGFWEGGSHCQPRESTSKHAS